VGNDFSGEDSMKNSIRLIAAGGLLATGVPLTAQAVDANVNVNVTATVNAACQIVKNSDVAFGNVDVLATATLLAAGEVTLTCNKGAAPVMSITTATRQMASAGGTLNYVIKQPEAGFITCPGANAGTNWTDTSTFSASTAFSSNGGPQAIKVCGQLTTPQLGAGAGSYTQTIEVRATY
jgi:spore coat protein U-like protein